MTYIPNTQADRQAMLADIGVGSVEDLFNDIPEARRRPVLRLPPALSEMELLAEMRSLSQANADLESYSCFLGAGAYRHFIPSVVGQIISRGEFYTSYTPYQAEVSQGTLQTMFEFQSLVCELTGMDVANASHYDGAAALAEAALMAVRITGRARVAVSAGVHPEYRATLETYAWGQGLSVETAPALPPQDLSGYACLIVQQPDFFGRLEEVERLADTVHQAGALLVASADPISLGLIKPPGAYGADIVVGEGQPLGIPVSFGGPYLGLFACRQEYVRQMPGRIVGETVDGHGRRGYTLTLQAREQHIRRERATSNICTNQALAALAATVYLAAIGKEGLCRVASLCYHKAHYAASRICALPGFSMAFDPPFFKEFTLRSATPPSELNRRLLEKRIIGGLDISHLVEGGWLLCLTEMNTRAEIDRLVEALAEMAK
ncbi:MAG: aminomethyl-transferring glycine dehydrogenase subunit GcvPA [Dehalococcoidia bacterium]|nr:aminomethyl-transferring glycine dehydrogenase subunit GcvPA [Dehalococcoidia bacterium]